MLDHIELTIATLHGAPAEIDMPTFQAFANRFQGSIIRPGDADYEEARHVWNGMIDKRPALIARCRDAMDVIAAVNFASTHHLLVAVRGGGHNVAGNATCDGGLVIDLSPMRRVQVDPAARIARVEAGANWGDVDRATQPFGLAVPGGVVSDTGVAGLTLSGGMGWLRRAYGLTIDSLRSVDVVTASGQFLRANEQENADLFWAIRGSGGNFGIVTAFEYRLHPVGPEVMMLNVMYPVDQARAVLRAWRDFTASAPDEATSDAVIWAIPPAPPFPEELHHRHFVGLLGVYSGAIEAGRQVFQPLRELGTPLLDGSGPMHYTALQAMFDPFFPRRIQQYYWKALYLNNASDTMLDHYIAWAVQRPSPACVMPLRHLGGAISRVGAAATAFGDRSAPFLLSIDATWSRPAEAEQHILWARAVWQDMLAFSNGGMYFNFPGFLEEGEELVRHTYHATYDRLAALKDIYDPSNLFRMNQNIRPTGG